MSMTWRAISARRVIRCQSTQETRVQKCASMTWRAMFGRPSAVVGDGQATGEHWRGWSAGQSRRVGYLGGLRTGGEVGRTAGRRRRRRRRRRRGARTRRRRRRRGAAAAAGLDATVASVRERQSRRAGAHTAWRRWTGLGTGVGRVRTGVGAHTRRTRALFRVRHAGGNRGRLR